MITVKGVVIRERPYNLSCKTTVLRPPSVSQAVPTFHPEYGRFMLESTPGSPYTGSLQDLISVEENMRYRCILNILSDYYLSVLTSSKGET